MRGFFLFFFTDPLFLVILYEAVILVFVVPFFIQHFRRFGRLGFSHFGHGGCDTFFCLCHQIISFPGIR